MKAIIIDNKLRYQSEFIRANKFNEINNVKGATEQQWYNWGFREYVVPVYTNLQKLGNVYFDNVGDIITYYVLDKTVEELESDTINMNQKIINEQQSKKQEIINTRLKLQVEAELIDVNLPIEDVFLYKDFFDFWANGITYSLNAIVNTSAQQLYRCVQAHTSQTDWHPSLVPALFTPIVAPGTIGVWIQPTGAQDAYNIGDQVHFPTETDPVYESIINANVWSPSVLPSGWQLI